MIFKFKSFASLCLSGCLMLPIWGCANIHTIALSYDPGSVVSPSVNKPKIAVIPFEDITKNGKEDHRWVGQANLEGVQLQSPQSISYLVTRAVKSEIGAFGYQLSPDEIYSIQINRNDLKTLLKRIPHIQVDFLVSGTIDRFFIHQDGRLIAEVEIEAYVIRPSQGEVIWTKKIGHREVRLPYPTEEFADQSRAILNNLLDKTVKDLFRNSDFRVYLLMDGKKAGELSGAGQ